MDTYTTYHRTTIMKQQNPAKIIENMYYFNDIINRKIFNISHDISTKKIIINTS